MQWENLVNAVYVCQNKFGELIKSVHTPTCFHTFMYNTEKYPEIF